MSAQELTISATATASLLVTEEDLASSLSLSQDDAYPAIFGTSRMIALMEIASGRILAPFLEKGLQSVGVSFDVTHTVPTPVDTPVIAEARYLGRTGKGERLYEFEVVAKDAGGEIGKGKHVRAVVDVARLESSAVRRIEKKKLKGSL